MFSFDIFTVIFMSMTLHLTMGLLFGALYRAGLGGRVLLQWSLALIALGIGLGCLSFRTPDVTQWTLPAGNLLVLGGTLWSVIALRRLLGHPLAPATIIIASAAIFAYVVYITFLNHGQYARSILSTLMISLFSLLVVVPLALGRIPNSDGLSRRTVLAGYATITLGYGGLSALAVLSFALPDNPHLPPLGRQVLWAFMLGPPTMVFASLGCLAVVIEDVNRQSRAFLERARAVVRKNPLAIILTEAESHRVVDVNDSFLRMFGLTTRNVVGQTADELGLFEQKRLDAYRRLLGADGAVKDLIVTRDTDEGENRTLKVSGYRLSLNSHDYFLTFINDISNEMRAADLLRREKEMAQHEARVKSRFLAIMSHEFRTPLSAAAGLAALLKAEEEQPAKRRRLDGILEAMSALTHLVEDVLDLSRLQNNELGSVVGACDPVMVVERVEAICGPSAARKGLDLRIEIDPHLPDQIVGDQNRIAQVTINLMHNAIKFTDTGCVTLHIGQSAADGARADRFIIEVRDTGPGIAPEERERLFKPFEQGNGTRMHDGVGLGLSICQQIVTMMDGDIEIDDNPGGGTIMRVSLPLLVGKTELQGIDPPPRLSDRHNPWAGLRVLIAEDTSLNREVLAEQLTRAGAQVVPVADGGPACTLAAVAEPPFDLVLLDMNMQGVSGPEASMRLRATPRGKSTLIAALTAYSEERDRQACEAAGMDLFFSKPYDLADMGRRIAATGARPDTVRDAGVSSGGSVSADGGASAPIGFDVVMAASGWIDDATPLATLLTRFADAYGNIDGQLTGLLQRNRHAELRTKVHQIRGLAALLQANHLKQEAARIETTLTDMKPDDPAEAPAGNSMEDATEGSAADLAGDVTRLEQLILAHVDLVKTAYATTAPTLALPHARAIEL